MQLRHKLSISALTLAVGLAGFFGIASAATPVLSVSQSNGNNIVRLTVTNADPFSTVGFYQQQGSGQLIFVSNYGQTDGSGFFSQLATLSADGSNNAVQEYVIINGQRSNTVTVFPNGFNSGGNFGNISLSQNNLVLNAGQSTSVTVSSSVFIGNSFYISNSVNTSVATASVSGNTITVFGNSAGSATFTVCQINNSQCASLFVTVNGNSAFGNITFSNSNPTLSVGQFLSINIFANNGSSNSFFVSNNTNSNVVSASVSGNTLNLQGINTGNATIAVCQVNNSQCANLSVNVTGNGGFNSGSITFSNSNLFMNAGQTNSVSIFSNNFSNNAFYVSSNSNNNAVSASVSGNSLNLNALSNGFATINVCQFNTNACGSVNITVGGGNNFGSFSLSQNNISIGIGQTATVTASNPSGGFNSFVISSNSNPNAVSANVSGNVISLYGLNTGTSTLSICQNNSGFQCQTLFVNVNTFNNNGSGISFAPVNPVLSVGQTSTVFITSNNGFNNGGYYVSSNSNPGIASATVSGSTISILGNNAGSANISVCQFNSNQCATLFITVNSNGSVLGANIYNNGTLINDGGAIFITYKNTKAGFANMGAFTGLGYSLKNVIVASTASLTNTGYVIATPFVAHPWGTWIINGGTIYFEDQTGLIPVSDWNVFLNNGGIGSAIVPANSFDMQRPILSVMVNSDSRLR